MGLCLVKKKKSVYCCLSGVYGGNRSDAWLNLPPAFRSPFFELFEICLSKAQSAFLVRPGSPPDGHKLCKCMFITSQSSCHFHFTESVLCLCLSLSPWLQFPLLLTQTSEIENKKEVIASLCNICCLFLDKGLCWKKRQWWLGGRYKEIKEYNWCPECQEPPPDPSQQQFCW